MGFLSKLLKKGEHSTNHVPQNEDSLIKRWEIPAEEIDQMQRITASEAYCKKIYRRFYRTYPEKPFISQDREYNTNWLDQAMLFPDQSLVPFSNMVRYKDGLLPGHIYMLYWICKYKTRKNIPSYFEYKYGIEFNKERDFLRDCGYLKDNYALTDLGFEAINAHMEVIQEHHPNKKLTEISQETSKSNSNMVQNNLDGTSYEKAGDIDEAIKLYEYNVAHHFTGNHPYDRLAIIYRKQKKYDEEIRVLKTAIDVFTNDVSDERRDKLPKLEKFKARLEKAEALQNK